MAEMVPPTGSVDSTAPIKFETSKDIEIITSFDGIGLQDEVIKVLRINCVFKPTDVQQRAIKPIINGRNVIIVAPPRNGKTTAVLAAILHFIVPRPTNMRVFCVSPTTEQVSEFKTKVSDLGCILNRDHLFDTDHCAPQLNINQYVDYGTPEHIFNMIKCDVTPVHEIKTLILDKVDQMLHKGLLDYLYQIYSLLTPATQVIILSDSMPSDILVMTQKFMSNPVKISIDWNEMKLGKIKQYYVITNRDTWKVCVICDLYNVILIRKAVVFCGSKDTVNWLSTELTNSNFMVSAIHEDLSKKERDTEIYKFSSESTNILITNDILTEDDITVCSCLTINFNLPNTEEAYIDRIKRSGTLNQFRGIVINLIKHDELKILRKIEEHFHTQISEKPMSIAKYI